jgi:salicylate biosynthesis isochorismate synthase/menaquinone-specific isochorismate synthase
VSSALVYADAVTTRTGLAAAAEHVLRGASDVRRRSLVSVTAEIEPLDPAAAVFASRLAGERWFCWEHPDRDGFALAGLGAAHELISRGPGRFDDVVRDCADLTQDRSADEPGDLPAGAGPVWVGGFAFAPDGGREAHWSSLPPALLFMPEVTLARVEGRCFATVAAVVGPGDDAGHHAERLRARLSSLRDGGLSLLDPSPAGARVRSALPPRDYEQAVARAVARIRDGGLEKVVLAREVEVEARAAHDVAALFGALRELFPACFCFCVGTPEAAFVGASPELLVRRNGAVAATVALAGSTRRSADPAVDDHLGEQLLRSDKERHEHEIVARRIERELRRLSVWVEPADIPAIVKVANIQHLGTPIHAQLAEPRSAVELAGILHPTPALGGEPADAALDAIAELEAMDRGWYAGPVGWMDAAEDGEFCVAIRSALVRDRTARLFAGCGIVADSDPAAELAESEIKLEALLPLLAG